MITLPPEMDLSDYFMAGTIPEESIGKESDLAIAQYIASACKKIYQSYKSTPEASGHCVG